MMMPIWRRLAIASALFIAFGAAQAADINARIKGTVTDPTGAVVPHVQVVAINEATGVKFTTTSQANGDYLFQQLPIGTYTVRVVVPGFMGFKASGIVLNIDQEYVEQVKLIVGNANQNIEVAADAVQVNSTDMQLNNIVSAAQMEELPLIGRDFTQLELTQPGVQRPDNRFGTFSVSGAQSQQSEYIVNGADTNDIALNTIVFTPNLDAIAEFNLVSGPLNAEYDRNSGGIVSATIKQGTNHFHGNIFEFYRDTFLNTNDFFTKNVNPQIDGILAVSPFHQNIFGGTIGGPILKDKLFFFGAYEGRRESIPQTDGTLNSAVYTAAQLGGDFSSDLTGNNQAGITGFSSNPIPSTVTIPGCSAGTTWANCLTTGVIPTSAFNSVTAGLAKKYIPAANSGTQYTFSPTTSETQDQYIGRVDYDFNPRNQITVLGLYQKSNNTNTLPFTGASLPGFGDGDIEHIQQWTLDYVRQVSSNSVNDFALHYTRFNFDSGAPQQIVLPSSVGFGITPQDLANATVPSLSVDNYFTLGGTTSGPQPRIDQVIQLSDSFSKVVGAHSLKFGYDGRRFNVSNTFDASNSGAYTFTTSGSYSTGDPGLDYLLGIPATYSQGTGNVIQADAFLNYFYAQDSWKVSSNFTLDYGLGYSIDTPLRDHQYGGEAISCFIVGEQSTIFPNAPTNLVYPGDPGCTDSGRARTHYNEFGPRLGFAWAPDLGMISGSPGKFSIRGGFGIYYDRTEEESSLETLGTPPFGFTSLGATSINGSPQLANPFADINGGGSTSNPFPYAQPVKGQPVSFAALEPIVELSTYDSTFRAPYAENFQLSVERELPSSLVARISYVGSLSHRNQIEYEGNYETAAGHANCLATPDCIANATTQAIAYPGNKVGNSTGIAEIGLVGSEGSSNYHSLQVSLTKRQTHGFEFQLSYTYGHALDNGSGFENSGFGGSNGRGYNQYNTSLNYGNAAFDTRHHFVFSPVYISPLIHGNAFSPLSLALSGWEVSGILTLTTGTPFDISYGGAGPSNSLYCDTSISFYACPDVPEQIAPLVVTKTHTRNGGAFGDAHLNYFSASSFAAEPTGTFGNIGRNPFHGPGFDNTDVILAKNFIVSANGIRRIQLRLESDNVFNHTNLGNPDGNYSDKGTFGEITGLALNSTSRRTQIAGKFYF